MATGMEVYKMQQGNKKEAGAPACTWEVPKLNLKV